ncbi:hypothetical protein GNY06_12800 [Elizabethkingia argentiflava]|uniref:Bacterial Pleckstrin homology domain-containing protein n=1 Tax=Elizabethkingia argenteiflava TaxID=2681556 RepID=A0A845PZI1_9FLAO|nr:hypothetical protein [Elizabethkingia argenteiflava]NAW52216.1 hypothetical protein [Elizabethkingia argenteiflava]
MNNNILYEEKQKLSTWCYVLLWSPLTLMLYTLYQYFILDKSLDNTPTASIALSVVTVFYICFLYFCHQITLRALIKEDGLHIRYFPFCSHRSYPWIDMEEISVKQYSPLTDYWGWGYREAEDEVVYTMKGSQAIKITLMNGKKILIGSQLPEDMSSIIKKRLLNPDKETENASSKVFPKTTALQL